jgi:alginate O-acetyltransferase complex protein AlgI
MLFHSSEFLIGFLPAVFLVYLLLAYFHCDRPILIWLTLASFVFYGWGSPQWLPLIVASILGNFFLGRAICPSCHFFQGRFRYPVFILGICANLFALGYFKYSHFLVENLNHLLGTDWPLEKTVLPLALSFFTFTQIAYLVDTLRGETKQYALTEYCFFVTFFPHLIAGPIVQHKEIMPQVEQEGVFRLRWENIQVGVGIFAVGLFKKLVLGDGSAEYVGPFFHAAATGSWVSTPEAWIGVLAYTFQIYFDFSGYSDMAIGLSRLFGIRLPLNFNSPYRSTNIIEFWRRWHISLSRFLRNYLYIPLGGNRRGTTLQYINLMTTMILGGLWHGAGWPFAVWGLLHGLYLVINHGFRAFVKEFRLTSYLENPIGLALGWALTMLAVMAGWVFFRSPDLATSERIFAMLAGSVPPSVQTVTGLYAEMKPALWMTAMALVILVMPNTQDCFANHRPALDAAAPREPRGPLPLPLVWSPTFLHGLAIGALLFLSIQRMCRRAPSEFLYFNF